MTHHGAGLLRISKDETLVEALKSQTEHPGSSPAERAMLAYTRKLTLRPAEVTQTDVQALRSEGFSDRAILEINAAAAYMNFVNRVAQGLGIELESAQERFTR